MKRRSFLRRILGGLAAAVGVWKAPKFEPPEQLEIPMAWDLGLGESWTERHEYRIGDTIRVRLPQRFTIYDADRTINPATFVTRDELPPV